MNSIWNKNFSAFKNRFPQLAQITGSVPVNPETFWKLENAKNGMITASEYGVAGSAPVRLHSAYNPEREASGAVSRDEVFSKSAIVFYGFGLGYHVIECAKKISEYCSRQIMHIQSMDIQSCGMQCTVAGSCCDGKVPRLVLIEPDVAHFFAALSVLDWTPVFEVENLVIAVGAPAESVLPLLEDGSKVNVGGAGVSDACFFDIPAFTAHAASYFDAVRSIVKRNKRKNEINAATLKKFGRLWCRNSLKNLGEFAKRGLVSSLEKKAFDEDGNPLPFLIIGAGPSLETILPYLRELQDRCVTVCVETALRALLRCGVQPDFVILTDPQFWAYRHIAGVRAPDSVFITEISAYPSVFRFECRNLLLCASQFPIGAFTQTKLRLTPGDLGTGGSVASSAWNFAHLAGAREIFVAGLDFAFPGKQTHIKGSSAEQTWHTLSSRLSSPDKFTAGALYSANATTGRDYTGAPVLTDSRMKMFAWWFESRLASCPETKTYTLEPQGLSVPGISAVSLEELLKRPVIKTGKQSFFKSAATAHSELAKNQIFELNQLINNFPRQEFLTEYPFLSDYL